MLVEAGLDPSAFVGALLPAALVGGPDASTVRVGSGRHFVVEADEYAGNFDAYRPADRRPHERRLGPPRRLRRPRRRRGGLRGLGASLRRGRGAPRSSWPTWAMRACARCSRRSATGPDGCWSRRSSMTDDDPVAGRSAARADARDRRRARRGRSSPAGATAPGEGSLEIVGLGPCGPLAAQARAAGAPQRRERAGGGGSRAGGRRAAGGDRPRASRRTPESGAGSS